jgi:hypothetical protein
MALMPDSQTTAQATYADIKCPHTRKLIAQCRATAFKDAADSFEQQLGDSYSMDGKSIAKALREEKRDAKV